ncbi:FAD-dependent oxidoreductase [Bosea caraganae]|uniref:FAD-dependent oxidoreductase n=1 Tax=Bosea caraganae TaxID=2763117 RepID=A0A370KYN1_9HYPH|nr:FAD-dependent oxidoreductase [Bosea caraganae]RDJ20100.1 FAD-dependent oxidoreductase [Bosea caraganae]RDJ24812.1 FAD-dependent oxidoreductase [Bosea caraganae]
MSAPDAFDLAVIGGGPAGASAAIEAGRAGLRVVLLDEGRSAGGQVYRAPVSGTGASSGQPDGAVGDRLRADLAASTVDCRFDHRIWLVERGFRVHGLGPDGPATVEAPRLVIAVGAQERHRPVPGWTLPGVIGLAGATNLIKSQKILPGRRVVVAGSGPLLLLVAASILKAGGELAAVIDANGRMDWLRHAPQLMARPDLVGRGAKWLAAILRAGVPLLSRHALRRIVGDDHVEGVVAGPVTGDWDPSASGEFQIACDAVCFGYGLAPATETTRLLGVKHEYVPDMGGWRAVTLPDGSTSVAGLYVCGDGAGVLGAAAAALQGRVTGLAAARDSGHANAADAVERLLPQAARAGRFGMAMTGLALPRDGLLSAMTPETIICRCEGLRRADIDSAIAAGSQTLNGLKSATRCGMGPCGGRVCEDTAAALIAQHTGLSREAIGQSTSRPPLRPVPLGQLAGAFNYLDLPMPEPAPQ